MIARVVDKIAEINRRPIVRIEWMWGQSLDEEASDDELSAEDDDFVSLWLINLIQEFSFNAPQ